MALYDLRYLNFKRQRHYYEYVKESETRRKRQSLNSIEEFYCTCITNIYL